MKLEYTPFWGCLIEARFPQIEASARKALPKLGVNLVDVPGFTCCPDPVSFRSADPLGWLAIAGRNLSVAAKEGRDVLTICSGCTSTLLEAQHILDTDSKRREMIDERLQKIGMKCGQSVSIKHVFKVLRDEVGFARIRESVVRPLTGLTVAPVYGCHTVRPSAVVGLDNPRFPSVFENLISAIGATAVPYLHQSLCCGHTSQDPEVRSRLNAEKIESMIDAGADCAVIICPSCFSECDVGQVMLEKKYGKRFGMPALHYLQLLAIALGVPPAEIGIDSHRIKADKVLEKIGLM